MKKDESAMIEGDSWNRKQILATNFRQESPLSNPDDEDKMKV